MSERTSTSSRIRLLLVGVLAGVLVSAVVVGIVVAVLQAPSTTQDDATSFDSEVGDSFVDDDDPRAFLDLSAAAVAAARARHVSIGFDYGEDGHPTSLVVLGPDGPDDVLESVPLDSASTFEPSTGLGPFVLDEVLTSVLEPGEGSGLTRYLVNLDTETVVPAP